MPESVAIGLIVLGGVLLLIGLAGGKFKLFGAEVESTPSKLSRFTAFLVGCICLLAGIGVAVNETPKPDAGPTADAPPVTTANAAASNAPAAPASPVAQQATTTTLPQLAGLWHDGNGTGVEIRQTGNTLHFQAANLLQGRTAMGEGIISGRQIQLTITTSDGLISHGNGMLGAGDRVMNFRMQDVVNGQYAFGLQRWN